MGVGVGDVDQAVADREASGLVQAAGVRIATFHLHTVVPGQWVKCTATKIIRSSALYGGPSGADWEGAQSTGAQGVREYVVDPSSIQRYEAAPDLPGYWFTSSIDGYKYPTLKTLNEFLKAYPRVENGCIRYHSPY